MPIQEEVKIDDIDIFNHAYRREMHNVTNFNLMLVGLSGIGKSSLVKSLFRGQVKPREADGDPILNEYCESLEHNGVRLRLKCIETSNFSTHNPDIYLKYIEARLLEYRQAQSLKSNVEDTRVHCCLYLVPPHGKLRLKDEDIACMRALSTRTNLVPIIPKSEFFEAAQKTKFKENILADLKSHNINCFRFSFDEKANEDLARVVMAEAERFPFAVVTADEPVLIDGRPRWVRMTDSCAIDIYDDKYDFEALSNLIIRHCMDNLITTTHIKHYEKFKDEEKDGSRKMEDIILELIENHGNTANRDRPILRQLKDKMAEELKGMKTKLNQLEARPKRPTVSKKPDFLRARFN